MKISVVIPLYNKEKYIVRAVESVLNQTLQAYEILVIDDGSTDKSAFLCSSIKDVSVILVSQVNSGESAARNKGIGLARGELVAFLDADDAWHPRFLEAIAGLRGNYPNAGIYSTAYEFVTSSSLIKQPRFYSIPKRSWQGEIEYFKSAAFGDPPVTSSSVAIPKNVFAAVGVFQVGKRLGPDGDMWGRIVLAGYQVVFDTEVLAIYYLNADERACNKFYPTDAHPFIDTHRKIKSGVDDIQFKKYLDLYVLRIILADARNLVLNKKFSEAKIICKGYPFFPFIKKRLLWTTGINRFVYCLYLFKIYLQSVCFIRFRKS